MSNSARSSVVERPVWGRKVAGSTPAAPTTRRCRVCGVVKPLDQYYDGTGRDGKFTACKACTLQCHRERARSAREARERLESGETMRSAQEIRSVPDEKLVRMVLRRSSLQAWVRRRIDAIVDSGVTNETLDGQLAAFRQVLRWLKSR